MGVYSDQPDPPTYFQAVQADDLVRYTDVSQAQWFFDRINWAFSGTNTNLRFDTDGTTIRWFGYYFLHLGDWLWKGSIPMSDEVLRGSAIRPVLDEIPEEA